MCTWGLGTSIALEKEQKRVINFYIHVELRTPVEFDRIQIRRRKKTEPDP